MTIKANELFSIASMAYLKMNEHPEDFKKTLPKAEEIIKFLLDKPETTKSEILIDVMPF